MKKVRHLIGRLLHRAGYELKPAWKGAAGDLNVVEAAVSDVDGHAGMFADAPDSPRASLLPGHQARFARSGSHGFTVETMRPQTLLSRFSLPVPDLLQVDAEGMDWRIVRRFFDAGMLPVIVNFEHLHLPRDQREEARARLSAEGYSWCEHGWDTAAVLSARFYHHGGGGR